jgi:hypothetical protein
MSYKLFTDKSENFECSINVKNASLSNSTARLVVESPEISLIFEGKIQNDKCLIPIRRLKGLLDENTTGRIKLEIIVEDMYFRPWESDFIVETHTKVDVKINEQKEPVKPTVSVIVEEKKTFSEKNKYQRKSYSRNSVYS